MQIAITSTKGASSHQKLIIETDRIKGSNIALASELQQLNLDCAKTIMRTESLQSELNHTRKEKNEMIDIRDDLLLITTAR